MCVCACDCVYNQTVYRNDIHNFVYLVLVSSTQTVTAACVRACERVCVCVPACVCVCACVVPALRV